MKVLGLVGCGAWGKNILRDLLQLGCTVHVADIASDALSRAKALGATSVFSSVTELPPCDGYVVAVPIPDLTPVCLALLSRRKPVFSEKTLCLSLQDYHALKRAGGDRFIFAMHKWHYHPGIEALRAVAASGRLGVVEQLCTTRYAWVDDFHGGDVFWTQAVHDLTIVKHILGSIPSRVRSISLVTSEEGLPVSFNAVMGSGPAVIISVSGRHCSKVSGVFVQGTLGCAALENAYDEHVSVRDSRGEEKIHLDKTLPLFLELKEFVAYLDGGPQPRCGLGSAWEVTRAILRLRKAAGLVR